MWAELWWPLLPTATWLLLLYDGNFLVGLWHNNWQTLWRMTMVMVVVGCYQQAVRGVSVQTKTLESLVPGVDTGQCRDHVQCPVSHWHQPLPDCVQHNVLHPGVSESLPDANLDVMNHAIILASNEVVRMRQQSLTPPPNPWCFHYACYPPPPLLLAMNWISNWLLSVHFLSKSKL